MENVNEGISDWPSFKAELDRRYGGTFEEYTTIPEWLVSLKSDEELNEIRKKLVHEINLQNAKKMQLEMELKKLSDRVQEVRSTDDAKKTRELYEQRSAVRSALDKQETMVNGANGKDGMIALALQLRADGSYYAPWKDMTIRPR